MAIQTAKFSNNFKYNRIPEFAREYQFIRGINKESKYVYCNIAIKYFYFITFLFVIKLIFI